MKGQVLISGSDDARLHSAPVYVHCKAGKSRSVTVVLAYLIHANAWTLKTAYAYVAERRKGISPNIGFVAELMSFEEAELGLKQSSGVHGEVAQPKDKDKNTGDGDGKGGQHRQRQAQGQGQGQRYGRDSLPPTWVAGPSSSFDSRPPERLPLAHTPDPEGSHQTNTQDREEGKGRILRDDREVMKNGQWVQQRRSASPPPPLSLDHITSSLAHFSPTHFTWHLPLPLLLHMLIGRVGCRSTGRRCSLVDELQRPD